MQHADGEASRGEPSENDPATRGTIDAAGALHRHIVRLRLVSARMVALQRAEKIGFHTSSIGEEAVIVGATLAAREDDWVFPGAREWGAALVRGLPLAAYVHHAFGNAEDPSAGHAPPDHPPARRVHVVPASGVVGAHLPQAVGCAWAAKIKKASTVAIALFGHAASTSGDFHNALNFAGVFKAPCVLVCRHDGRAAIQHRDIADRAAAYGLASISVDGTDALAVSAARQEAVARAAEGKGPTLVEAVTKPLAPSDAQIASGNVLDLGSDDPLVKIRRAIGADASREEAMVQTFRAELEVAIADAERAAKPRQSTIFEDVYAEVPPHLRAQEKELLSCRK